MSKMSDLWIVIEEMLSSGMSIYEVSKQLDIPLEWVISVEESLRG